uniref:Regulatory protein zeste n=1 Tax=Romanomermis culicivorax TaxID=13658 RepID=A0A915JPI8_ROMCU
MSSDLEKKQACKWTDPQTKLLRELCLSHRSVLEASQKDAMTEKRKKHAWEEITSSLNGAFPEAVHDVKDSAKKWSNLKSSAKKVTHDQKKWASATGGGPPHPAIPETLADISLAYANSDGFHSISGGIDTSNMPSQHGMKVASTKAKSLCSLLYFLK